MTVEELIEVLKKMPHDAYVYDESQVDKINYVECLVFDEDDVRVCLEC